MKTHSFHDDFIYECQHNVHNYNATIFIVIFVPFSVWPISTCLLSFSSADVQHTKRFFFSLLFFLNSTHCQLQNQTDYFLCRFAIKQKTTLIITEKKHGRFVDTVFQRTEKKEHNTEPNRIFAHTKKKDLYHKSVYTQMHNHLNLGTIDAKHELKLILQCQHSILCTFYLCICLSV